MITFHNISPMATLGRSLSVMTTKRGSQSRFQWLVGPKQNMWPSLCDFPSGARQINRPSNHRLSDRAHDLLFTVRQSSPKTRSPVRGAKSSTNLSASPGRLTARHRSSPSTSRAPRPGDFHLTGLTEEFKKKAAKDSLPRKKSLRQ